ncbi:hypothetical protein FACS1894170_07670 [Planctomycetales bacterium]|nr:hypothetical protein FACS1894170_07670 [Planctomycetales bacterium]
MSGSVLASFVQTQPFYTAFHVMVLIPKHEMCLEEKLFYCHCIKMNAYRYSFGRQANKTLKDVNLPPLPDWLKNYTIDYSRITTLISKRDLPIDTSSWKRFRLDDELLFNISGTTTTPITKLKEIGSGPYPYLTTKSSRNAVAGFYNYFTETGNVLVIDSAVAGFCSYQAMNFSASDHVEKLVPKFAMNKYIGLFLATIINLDGYKYNYGRKYNQEQICNTVIKLPVANGIPDWQFMEDYIIALQTYFGTYSVSCECLKKDSNNLLSSFIFSVSL